MLSLIKASYINPMINQHLSIQKQPIPFTIDTIVINFIQIK